VKRREFITLLGGALVACYRAGETQFSLARKMEVDMRCFLLAATTFALLAAMPSARAAGIDQLEANKKTVAAFEDAALNQKDFDAASKYLGARYIQHNPNAADGSEGLKGYIAFLRDKFPNNRSEIKHVFADGDYVIVHDHAVREPGTRGLAIVNIYRLENGKVVEHWDVIQPIPETAANGNGMF
jgi:predicted SnoaL-like aldol condensation-catalyzing enzyme